MSNPSRFLVASADRPRRAGRPTLLLAILATALAGAVASSWVARAFNPVLGNPRLLEARAAVFVTAFAVWLLPLALVLSRQNRRLGVRTVHGAVDSGLLLLPLGTWLVWALCLLRDPQDAGYLGHVAGGGAWLFIAAVGVLAAAVAAPLWGERWGWFRRPLIADGRAGLLLVVAVVGSLLTVGGGSLPRAMATRPAPVQALEALDVRVVGIDGADWRTIDALIADGRLPHFQRLRAEAFTAPMASIPGGPSPLIWTTIATGARPREHGVTGFYEYYVPSLALRVPARTANPLALLPAGAVERRKTPYSGWLRAPLWELLARAGGDALVVNWLFSHPGERAPGLTRISDSEAGHRLTCQAFGLPRETCRGPDRTFQVFHTLLQRDPNVDLAAYYTANVDEAGHKWLHYYMRDRRGRGVPKVLESAWHGVVAAYERADRYVGQVMDAAVTDTVVAVMSDHGWDYDERSHRHFPPGILAIWRPNADLSAVAPPAAGLTVYHVTPLLASAVGMPAADNWPGADAAAALAAELFPRQAVRRIAAYPVRDTRPRASNSSRRNRAYMERLRSMGYLNW